MKETGNGRRRMCGRNGFGEGEDYERERGYIGIKNERYTREGGDL